MGASGEALASGQERNILIVNGRVPETCYVAFALQGGQGGTPLANDLCNRCSELLIWDAEAALRGFQMKPLA